MTGRQFDRDKTLGEKKTPGKEACCNKVVVPGDAYFGGTAGPPRLGSLSIDRILGVGAFSSVLLVQSQAQQLALKMTIKGCLRQEVEIGKFLAELKHPFFVKNLCKLCIAECGVGDGWWATCGGHI